MIRSTSAAVQRELQRGRIAGDQRGAPGRSARAWSRPPRRRPARRARRPTRTGRRRRPRASRGRSVWVNGTGAAISVAAGSAWDCPSRRAQGRSLWPSRTGVAASSARAAVRTSRSPRTPYESGRASADGQSRHERQHSERHRGQGGQRPGQPGPLRDEANGQRPGRARAGSAALDQRHRDAAAAGQAGVEPGLDDRVPAGGDRCSAAGQHGQLGAEPGHQQERRVQHGRGAARSRAARRRPADTARQRHEQRVARQCRRPA